MEISAQSELSKLSNSTEKCTPAIERTADAMAVWLAPLGSLLSMNSISFINPGNKRSCVLLKVYYDTVLLFTLVSKVLYCSCHILLGAGSMRSPSWGSLPVPKNGHPLTYCRNNHEPGRTQWLEEIPNSCQMNPDEATIVSICIWIVYTPIQTTRSWDEPCWSRCFGVRNIGGSYVSLFAKVNV